MWSTGLIVDHLLCVTMISTDKENTINLINCLYSSANALVNCLYSLDSCWDNTCMTNHIRVCKVDDDHIILATKDSCIELLAYLWSAHLWLEVICCYSR